MTFIFWIIYHLGAPLLALIIIASWFAVIFVVIDEIRGLRTTSKTPTRYTQDGEL